jgi:hypothetical protein
MHRALRDFFDALQSSPTGLLEGQTNWVTGFRDYTHFVGLNEYRRKEDDYLPESVVAEKYGEVAKACP